MPSEEEIGAAQKLLDEFLADEVSTLTAFADGKIPLNRDQLLNRLNVVSNILHGCGSLLPFWKNGCGDDKNDVDEDFCPKKLVDSVTDLTPLEFVTVPRALKLTLQGKNVRQEIATTASKLQVNGYITGVASLFLLAFKKNSISGHKKALVLKIFVVFDAI